LGVNAHIHTYPTSHIRTERDGAAVTQGELPSKKIERRTDLVRRLLKMPDVLILEDREAEAEPFVLDPQKSRAQPVGLPQLPQQPQIRPKTADTQAAFSAAEAASAATASVISCGVKPEDLAARLVGNVGSDSTDSTPPPMCDRLAACHRLNEHFAACPSYEESMRLSALLCSAQPRLGEALVAILVDGDALVELAVQLMHNLCTHEAGSQMLSSAGALPVLTAALRADEPLLRAHGLALLAALADRRECVPALAKAGVVRLICFLGRTLKGAAAGALWPFMLEIAEGMLRVPSAIPEAQHKMLRKTLGEAALSHKCGQGRTEKDLYGTLPLDLADGRRLTRLLVLARAFESKGVPPPGELALA
jgi:hypothetical protein